MFLALSPIEMVARPVHLPAEQLAAIVAELERNEDFPAAVTGRCALCHGPLAGGESDGTGVAHRECGEDAMREIENDQFDEWVQSMERTYG